MEKNNCPRCKHFQNSFDWDSIPVIETMACALQKKETKTFEYSSDGNGGYDIVSDMPCFEQDSSISDMLKILKEMDELLINFDKKQ